MSKDGVGWVRAVVVLPLPPPPPLPEPSRHPLPPTVSPTSPPSVRPWDRLTTEPAAVVTLAYPPYPPLPSAAGVDRHLRPISSSKKRKTNRWVGVFVVPSRPRARRVWPRRLLHPLGVPMLHRQARRTSSQPWQSPLQCPLTIPSSPRNKLSRSDIYLT